MIPTKYLDSFWLLVKYLLISLGIALVLRGFIFIPMMVEGNSMNPLLDNRDMILVERLTQIKRFDVIVFQEGGTTYIKRVIALPGEKLAYKKQQLYINDKPVKEYFKDSHLSKKEQSLYYDMNDFSLDDLLGVEKLGRDSYFVLGDNRRISKDSRSFGTVSSEQILGKACGIYYPFTHIKII